MSSFNQDMHRSPGGRPENNMQVPSSPERSQLSTPKISHNQARAVILETPPLILNTFSSPKHQLPTAPSLDYDSDHTPTSLGNDQYHFDPLEPPAWKPPEQDEVEYVDSWNNTYNNSHHFLNGYSYKDDSSTICSSQTNNSLGKSYSSRDRPGQQILRPRGFSINSYGSANKGSHFRHPSFGSCPQQHPKHGQKQHHRHDSLPVALFSSTNMAQSSQIYTNQQSQQSHPLLTQKEEYDKRMNKRAYHMIQARNRNGPYEMYSDQHASQVKADATIAGLSGILVDLYAVDRCVDGATAKMLATSSPAKNAKENSRKTSMGTLKDIRSILELHKVDKMVDRFKHGLQMPVFFEEEDADLTIVKELRSVDLLIEEVHKNKEKCVKSTIHENMKQNDHHQFELSEDDDEEESWDKLGGGNDDGIYLSTDSFHTDLAELDPYHFYDPQEATAMASNSFEQIYAATSRDDLNDVMDFLQVDVEVDGASRRHKEFNLVHPLLEVDRSVLKWRRQVEEKRYEKELLDLFLVDVAVNGAKKRAETTCQTPSKEEEASKDEELNKSSIQCGQESCGNHLDSPVITSERSLRSIFTHREKLHSSLAASSSAVSDYDTQFKVESKRSIFTDQEKTQGNLGS